MGKKAAVGLDLGGTRIKAGLVTEEGRLLSRLEENTPECFTAIVQKLVAMTRTLRDSTDDYKAVGVGLGVPGMVNGETLDVQLAPNLGWRGVNLRDMERQLGLPLRLGNDADLASLAEARYGSAKAFRHFLMITIGTGIGSGLFLNGELFLGEGFQGSEIGHVTANPGGPICSCGRRGCLETMTAAPAVVRVTKEHLEAGRKSILANIYSLEARDVYQAAAVGDELAVEVVHQVASLLGEALANAVLLVNVEAIVIGGGVAAAGDTILQPLTRVLRASLAPFPLRRPLVAAASLGNDAGIIGAAALALGA